MNEPSAAKIEMKLVIDPIDTPFLHARLSKCSTPRKRAALLRILGELAAMNALQPSTLPGQTIWHPAGATPIDDTAETSVSIGIPPTRSPAIKSADETAKKPGHAAVETSLPLINEDNLDLDIANQFAAFD